MRSPSLKYVLYHAHCDDGFGAAWAAWRRLGDSARYVPISHDDPVPAIEDGAEVAMIDVTLPRHVLIGLAARTSLTVLDHHQTARKELAGLPFARFDMEKSGAVLAWEFYHPGQQPPALLLYIQDKDLWRFRLPDSKEVNAAIGSYPHDLTLWSQMDVPDLARQGGHILRGNAQQVARMVERVAFTDIGGYRVPVVNASVLSSEVLEELLRRHPEAPFAACYFDRGDGKRQWGLAGRGTFDVAEIARQYGGGGHHNRSGFAETV